MTDPITTPAGALTLASLIASRDFVGRKAWDAGWFMDGDEIESALYGTYGSWSGSEHASLFFENEKMTSIDIDKWICTDTRVGLELLLLNGEPVAVTWQSARKADKEMRFISAEARDLFVTAWERHRPAPDLAASVLDEATLNMPVAPAGQEPYGTWGDLGRREGLHLSVSGVARWLAAVAAEGGLGTVSNEATLKCVEAGLRAEIGNGEARLEEYAGLPAERREAMKEPLAKVEAEILEYNASIRAKLLDPIQARLADLAPDTPAA
ncbi:hypothetical protein [Defluviimonas salinarum]|uniref:Uncharacterized protein n=1 Tax=Defluviimonas salinarum TaxID=2992147 RepID=A0ABT3J5N5_9RHOB|nr:hypothetical protein [Defluviimonas salinarum]MCW3783005.1 hypothetical protein [Defluviimonas salinarum]